jgi:hypothetical protein
MNLFTFTVSCEGDRPNSGKYHVIMDINDTEYIPTDEAPNHVDKEFETLSEALLDLSHTITTTAEFAFLSDALVKGNLKAAIAIPLDILSSELREEIRNAKSNQEGKHPGEIGTEIT